MNAAGAVALALGLLAPGVALAGDGLGYEVTAGADVTVPQKAAASLGLLVGPEEHAGGALPLGGISGGFAEASVGLAGVSVRLGAETSVNRGLLGFGLGAELLRTWEGPAGGPWAAEPDQIFYGVAGHATFLFATVSAGVLTCTEGRRRTWIATLGFGGRFGFLSSVD